MPVIREEYDLKRTILRGTALLAALLMLLPAVSCKKEEPGLAPTETTPIAEEKESGTLTEGGATYTLYKTYAELSAYSGTEKEIVLPARVGGLPVLKIGKDAFYFNGILEKVTLPEGLIVIGQSAFDKCKKLTTVVFPASLEVVGDFSFRASGITEAVFADGLYSIGKYAFQDTPLRSVSVPDSCSFIGKYAFSGSAIENAVIPLRVTSLSNRVFSNCDALKTVVLPRSVVSIDEYVFSACDGLETVVIPPEVTSIREGLLSSSPNAVIVAVAGSEGERIANRNGYPLTLVTEEELAAYYPSDVPGTEAK